MKGKMTVSHAKFQYYRHNYCLICMTGSLGCRWHRYQQSTRQNRKRDMFWFTLFVLTFLFVTFYFYFWLISEDGYNNLEWYMFKYVKTWLPWYTILLALASTVFAYCLLIMILYLCHAGHGHQMFIHTVHLVFIVLALLGCVAVTIMVDKLWRNQFTTIYLSLQMFGPFLHIGVVVIMTALMWLISHSWYKLSSKLFQLLWLVVMVGGMVGLYIAPLYIQCPCLTTSSPLPPKPRLFAHRGAEAVAPENTVISFQKAVQYGAFGLESDVRISFDGVPFIHHDDTFLRTTNIKDVFPDRKDDDVSLFNISDIKQLNAGSWFFEQDPFSTAGSVSGEDRALMVNQSVPLLVDLLTICQASRSFLMFDVRPTTPNSPFHFNYTQVVIDTLTTFNYNMSTLYWLVSVENVLTKVPPFPPGAVLVLNEAPSVMDLTQLNLATVNIQYDAISAQRVEMYRDNNLTSNIYVVDSGWFFSYFWCVGASSITTRRIDQLSTLEDPVWSMAKSSYMILWVSVDVLSAVIIIVIFIIQRIRLFGTSFSPESVSLTSARRARNYRSRTMKEKLLREGVMEVGGGGGGGGTVNHPAAYAMSCTLHPSTSSASFSNNAAAVHASSPASVINSQPPDAKQQLE